MAPHRVGHRYDHPHAHGVGERNVHAVVLLDEQRRRPNGHRGRVDRGHAGWDGTNEQSGRAKVRRGSRACELWWWFNNHTTSTSTSTSTSTTTTSIIYRLSQSTGGVHANCGK